ncbi:hypothetical protein [Hoeflea ulvae]|uniref:MarR family transcriptional regulator n=1 Tax=Hoeflea ulvae TaxID=2983764 RepID=A0ABT3YFJ9_9HYPH|nr:hypothetical protein [Hoeflea ulvae]MCY0094602.1 hypothetical protein [Hoeflea ulvae]
MSIYRTPEFQRMEAARQPDDSPPEAAPLNRTALYWLMFLTDDNDLSPDARTLAIFVGTEAIGGRAHSPSGSLNLTSGAGLSRAATNRAITELVSARLIELVDGEICLLAETTT